MSHERYHSEKFINTVIRNLPPPGRCGPQTEAGKAAIRYNAVKHGLNVKGFLPCKADRCFYKAICPLLQRGISFESELCPLELSTYMQMSAELEDTLVEDVDRDLVDRYIRQRILLERYDRYLSLNPEIERGVTKFPKAYIFRIKEQKKLINLIQELRKCFKEQ